MLRNFRFSVSRFQRDMDRYIAECSLAIIISCRSWTLLLQERYMEFQSIELSSNRMES